MPSLRDFVPDKIRFIRHTDFLLLDESDHFVSNPAIRLCVRKMERRLETTHRCPAGTWWTSLLSYQLLNKFACELRSESVSWLDAYRAVMTLSDCATKWLDDRHLQHLIKDCAILIHAHFFEKCLSQYGSCGVFLPPPPAML
jgi:hypothetical protein